MRIGRGFGGEGGRSGNKWKLSGDLLAGSVFGIFGLAVKLFAGLPFLVGDPVVFPAEAIE